MGVSLFSDISLIIPSYERPTYLLRSLKFWNDYDLEVFVLDGSSVPLPVSLLEQFNPKIKYFHMPTSFEERILFGINQVNTKYVALLGDDEYFLPSGLLACKGELEVDPHLVSCIGTCVEFSSDGENIFLRERYTRWLEYGNISFESPVERLNYYGSNAMSSISYSLIRTEVWKKAAKVIAGNPNGVTFLTEIFLELVVCYAGKTKVIPNLMWLRSVENQTHWESQETVSIEKWLNDKHFKYEKDGYLNRFTNVFNVSGLPKYELHGHIESTLQNLVSRSSVLLGVQGLKFNLTRIIRKVYYLTPSRLLQNRLIRLCIKNFKVLFFKNSLIDRRGLEKGDKFIIPLNVKNNLQIHPDSQASARVFLCSQIDLEKFVRSIFNFYKKEC